MESKSRSQKACCGMPVEKACFIFAVVNAVIVSACTLACLGFLGFMMTIYLDPGQMREQSTNTVFLFFNALFIVCCVGTAFAFTFAVLLCVGLSKKNPQYVMAYLVYGILTEVISVGGILSFIWMEWEEWSLIGYATIFLVVCVGYLFVLLLVYRTYVVLSNATPAHLPLFSQRKLASNDYES